MPQGVHSPPGYLRVYIAHQGTYGCTSGWVTLTGVPQGGLLSQVYHAGYTTGVPCWVYHGCTSVGVTSRNEAKTQVKPVGPALVREAEVPTARRTGITPFYAFWRESEKQAALLEG